MFQTVSTSYCVQGLRYTVRNTSIKTNRHLIWITVAQIATHFVYYVYGLLKTNHAALTSASARIPTQDRECELSYTRVWEVIQEPYRTSISIIW